MTGAQRTQQDNEHARAVFARDGYIVLREVLDENVCTQLRELLEDALEPLMGPAEFEADTGYPGAPADRNAPGGATPRRLLHAYSRAPQLRALARHAEVGQLLHALMGSAALMSQCHHNCVMTKHPGFSSATLWHQDIRYWSFDRPELISAWFALGEETVANGALQVIPGTHVMNFDRGRLDRDLFLRPELEDNQALIERAVPVHLQAGDVLLFHCRLFHAAGRNASSAVKLSPVFTYHTADNKPIPGTRSAVYPSVAVE